MPSRSAIISTFALFGLILAIVSFTVFLSPPAYGQGGAGEAGVSLSFQPATFTTNDGQIRVELPSEWSEIEGSEWIVDEEDFGALLQASSDLTSLYTDKTTAGIVLGFTSFPIEYMSDILLLDWHDNLNKGCLQQDRTEFEISITHLGLSLIHI